MDTDKFLSVHRRKKAARRILLIVVIVIFTVTMCTVASLNNASPGIVDYGREKLRSLTMLAVNDAAFCTLNQQLSYDELVLLVRDNDGKLIMLQYDTQTINLLARQLEKEIEERLGKIEEDGVDIPLGNLTNWPLFTGTGPTINVTVTPREAVKCAFKSDFIQAGINQTLHRIAIDINVTMSLLMPTYSSELLFTSQVLLAENLLIGEVPELYIQP